MSALHRFQDALARLGADAAIISSEINIRYVCGFDYTDGYLFILKDKAYLLADFRYIEAAKASVTDFEVIRPESDMLSELKLLVSIHDLRTVAVEDKSLSYSDFLKWSEKFDSAELVAGASETLTELRTVKTEAELSLIAHAQSITDAAFEHILGFITPERTEREVALELEFFMRGMGAEAVAFDTIAVSGASSSLPHGVPSDKKLSSGFLTMDFGAKYKGYCSDMTRTVVIGRADGDIKRVYNTVLRAQLAALDGIREGILCREADRIARDIIDGEGFSKCFGHSLGHGVGMYIHESPPLSPRAPENSILCRGNVVTVEPGIYLEGRYGCRIEDMIAISHDGSIVNFTKSTKELIEIL